VLDFPSPAAAFAAAQEGDAVHFPGIAPYTAPVGGWLIDKSLNVFGDTDGLAGSFNGTVLRAASDPNSPVFVVTDAARKVHIHDLQLLGPSGLGTGSGIQCQAGVEDIALTRVFANGFAAHGFQFTGTASTPITAASLMDCTVRDCTKAGVLMDHVTDALLMGCAFHENQGPGLEASECGVALYQCGFDGNSLANGLGATDGNLECVECTGVRVDACRFVNFDSGQVRKACVLVSCDQAMVDACFLDGGIGPECEGVVVTGAGTGPAVILSNRFKRVETMVRVDAGARDAIVLPQYDETGSGTIVLPSPNEGMFGAAHINRPAGNALTGLIVPSSTGLPTENLRDGMLAYHPGCEVLLVRQGGVWRAIETLP